MSLIGSLGHGDDVGELAGFDRADLVLHAEQLGGGHVGGAQRLRRSHPVLHHEGKLFRRIDLPVEAAGIGAEGNLHARLQRPAETCLRGS